VEVEAITSIIEGEVRKFIDKNIITKCRVHRVIVLDNGRQFDIDKVTEYYF